jgi:hypothetical protein
MKFLNVIIIIALCYLNSVNAQDTIHQKTIYRTWVTLKSKPFKTKGALYETKDSSILVSNSLAKKDYSNHKFETLKLHIKDIETIKIRKKDNIDRGILLGALTGLIVGSMLAVVNADPPCPQSSLFCFRFTAKELAVLYGVPLSLGGAAIGGILGSVKLNFPINGSMEKYNKNKEKLNKYSLRKE